MGLQSVHSERMRRRKLRNFRPTFRFRNRQCELTLAESLVDKCMLLLCMYNDAERVESLILDTSSKLIVSE